MHTIKTYHLITSALLITTLFSCGDGGSGSNETGVNYTGNTNQANIDANNGGVWSSSVFSAEENTDPGLPNPAAASHSAKLARLTALAKRQQAELDQDYRQINGINSTSTQPCLGGEGDITTNGPPTAVRIVYRNCKLEADTTINGTMLFEKDSVGNPTYNKTTFLNFQMQWVDPLNANSVETEAWGGSITRWTGSNSITFNITYIYDQEDPNSPVIFLNDFKVTSIDNLNGTFTGGFSGRIYHSQDGYTDIETTSNFTYDTKGYATTGVLTIAGADAKMTVTVIPNTTPPGPESYFIVINTLGTQPVEVCSNLAVTRVSLEEGKWICTSPPAVPVP